MPPHNFSFRKGSFDPIDFYSRSICLAHLQNGFFTSLIILIFIKNFWLCILDGFEKYSINLKKIETLT